MKQKNIELINRRFHERKKGQIEIFGLAVIVIMLSIGLYLVVVLKSKNKPPTFQKDYVTDKLPSDFVISMTQVTIDACDQNYNLGNMLKDCATVHRIQCSGHSSCELANNTISRILNQTFFEWDYSFMVETEGLSRSESPEINISNQGCGTNITHGRQGEAPIPLSPEPGVVFLRMYICK